MDITITNADLSESAKQAVRLNFNPSASDRITRIKMLTAALATECEKIAEDTGDAQNLCPSACGHIVTASMWTVLAATQAS